MNWQDIVPGIEKFRDTIYESGRGSLICPPRELCFQALLNTPPDMVRVVILGQDPYHTPGKANGLAFGYHEGYWGTADSSMRNIITELGIPDNRRSAFDYTLEGWAWGGVLLLNTRFTVEAGKPLSHAGLGWEDYTLAIVRHLHLQHSEDNPIVFMAWGSEAYDLLVDSGMTTHDDNVIVTSHPSPFSHNKTARPFTGSKCFERVNKYLVDHKYQPIMWY